MFNQVKADALFTEGNYREAFEAYFRGAVDGKDPRATFDLAFMYYNGYHSPRNYVWARKFYRAAARLESGEAQFNLALMCMRGQGGAVELDLAYRLMQESAERGCVHARIYLGVAYTTGCLFDPAGIECLSMIPYPRVVKRNMNALLLTGSGHDPTIEDKRYELFDADETDALRMFSLAAEQKDDTYISEQIGSAKFVMGQALIEGFGRFEGDYSPVQGYKMIEQAAIEHKCKEAQQFISQNSATAAVYGIDTRKVRYLLEEGENS